MTIGLTDRSSPDEAKCVGSSGGVPVTPSDHLASHERKLWRLTLVVLMTLALGLAAISWNEVRASTLLWPVLPIGLVVLVALFGYYIFSKSREVAALRGLVRGLEQRAAGPPDIVQLERLFGLVQRSQQGYRDLIDTFEDLLFSLSPDGEILAANRSFADLLGHPFAELMGRPLDEFVEIAAGAGRAAA